jgi:hypothetical protein
MVAYDERKKKTETEEKGYEGAVIDYQRSCSFIGRWNELRLT